MAEQVKRGGNPMGILVNLICAGPGDHTEAYKSDWRKIVETAGISCQYSDISGHHHLEYLRTHIPEMRAKGVEFFVALLGLKPDLGNVIVAIDRELVVYNVPIPSSSLGSLDPSSAVLTNPTGTVIRCLGIGNRGLTNTALDIWKDLARTDPAMRASYNAFMATYKPAPKPDITEEEFFKKPEAA